MILPDVGQWPDRRDVVASVQALASLQIGRVPELCASPSIELVGLDHAGETRCTARVGE